jgi:nicotinate-nucleotide pyrophosphorylase
LAKANGVLSGLKVVEQVFASVDKQIQVKWSAKDGDAVVYGTRFGEVTCVGQYCCCFWTWCIPVNLIFFAFFVCLFVCLFV